MENSRVIDKFKAFGKRVAIYLSPKECTWLLAYSSSSSSNRNRNISIPFAEEYTRAMNNRQWGLTGQGIIVDHEGKLLDGWTRVFAGSQSKTGFDTYVTFGISRECAVFMDSGHSRRARDHFKVMQKKYYKELPALITFILSWEAGNIADQFSRSHKRTHWSMFESSDCCEKHEEILVASLKISLKAQKVIGSGVLNFFGWWFVSFVEDGERRWEEFILGLTGGANLSKHSPVLGLRNYILNNKANKLRKILPVEMYRAVVFTAEKFLKNQKTKRFASELGVFRENSWGFSDFYSRFVTEDSINYLHKLKKDKTLTTFSNALWVNLQGKSVPEYVKSGLLELQI